MAKPPDAEFRARLTPEQFRVTQDGATERAFTGQRFCIDSAALDFEPEPGA